MTTISQLDAQKSELLKQVNVLVAKKESLYSNMDIESPMSSDEKELNKEIANIYSEINSIVAKKRALKN